MKKTIVKKCRDNDKSAGRIKMIFVKKEKGNKSKSKQGGFKIQGCRKEQRPEDLHIKVTTQLASIVRTMAKNEKIEISELIRQMIKYCLDMHKKGRHVR